MVGAPYPYHDHWYKFPGVAQCTGVRNGVPQGRAGSVPEGGLLRAKKKIGGGELAAAWRSCFEKWRGAYLPPPGAVVIKLARVSSVD